MCTRATIAAACLALLAACQLSLPGGSGGKPASGSASPITGGAITTTKLDSPPTAGTTPAPAAIPAAAGAALTGPQTPTRGTGAPQAAATATPGNGATKPGGAEATATPPVAEAPVVIKSPEQLACEKRGGRWASVGGGRSCLKVTRDSGKRCTKKSDCQGQCLARSGTCAPVDPMFGCNEVLTPNGLMVTECLN